LQIIAPKMVTLMPGCYPEPRECYRKKTVTFATH
jgi:hypothetical protein